jgi:hypothetical protein
MDKSLNVLFVEDSEIDTELICAELKRGGFGVDFNRVDTADAFLSALHARPWDLIISDFSMPNFDGLKAFDLFSKEKLDIPFIFVSGAMGEERAVQAMKAGARDYILKGHLGRLNAAVQRELDEAASRRKRREVEAARQREQGRLAVALQATGAGVFEYRIPADDHGYCNARFAEIFGLRCDDLPPFAELPEWFFDRIHPDDRQMAEEGQQNFVSGKSLKFVLECRVRHKDGSWRQVTCMADAASRDENGAVRDLVGVMLDRTGEKQMEEQFRQAQKMEAIGQLAGGVAHDFNNLLTVISSFGEFVLERLEPDSEVHGDMQEVLKAAGRAETLTAQLLAYSRRRPVVPTVLNVNQLVGNVDKMLRRLLGQSIEFRTDLAADLWNVRIDAGGLEQVLVNLAVNARDAMPDGGRLTIETANAKIGGEYRSLKGQDVPSGLYVTISITDSGVGMDEATQSRLFEPFFTTKDPGKGTGLGLATCYGIVKQAGGFIWVYSEPGDGTTFKVLFPSVSEEPEIDNESTHSEKLRGAETILVVEDDESVRRLVVRLLEMLGYQVLEAGDAAEALRIAGEHDAPIHAVLTDVVMPDKQGPALVMELADLHPDIRPIYMSGYTRGAVEMDETIVLVQKPFSRQDLARTVRNVLDRSE